MRNHHNAAATVIMQGTTLEYLHSTNIEVCPTINSTPEVVHAGLPLSKFAKNEPFLDMYLTQPPVTTIAIISNSEDHSGYYGYTAHIICNHNGVTLAISFRRWGNAVFMHLAAIL